jgi:ferredoxin
MRIEVDRERCEGHGMCEQVAPQLFRLDDEGVLHVVRHEVPDEQRAAAESGARVCPVAALRVLP